MFIVRNALRNIGRSKGRNVLIGIIVLVIAISSCVALSIRQAASKAEKTGLETLKITGQITVNREALFQNTQSGSSKDSGGENIRSKLSAIQNPTLEELKTYAGAASVSGFYYTVSSTVNAGADTLEPVSTSESSSNSDSGSDTSSADSGRRDGPGGAEGSGGGGREIPGGMGTQGDFTLMAYSGEEAMTGFADSTSKITDGTMIDLTASDNACLITDELAALNNLAVGDIVTVANPNKEEETYTLTIAGIYNNATSGSTGRTMRFSTADDPANQIILSTGSLNAMAASSESAAETSTDEDTGVTSTTALRTQTSGTYVFKDTASYEAFPAEAKALGLPDEYTVTSTDVTGYEQSLIPLKNLSRFAGVFLLVVLLIGGIILVVLNIFNVHERKYEVGVLTAIGMKKGKVALQFIAEIFAVTIVSILIGTGIGAAVSLPVANSLLASQITAQESQSTQREQNFGRGGQTGGGEAAPENTAGGGAGQGGGVSPGNFFGRAGSSVVSYVSSVQSATNLTVVLELLGIGVLLTLLSSLVAVVFILRYEPLKILTSRT